MSLTTVQENGRARPAMDLVCQRPQDDLVTTGSDFPEPRVLVETEPFVWNDDRPPAENYAELGRRLAAVGDLYRNPQHASGLLVASPCALIPPTPVLSGKVLAPVIADRLPIVVVRNGKFAGSMPSTTHLNTMLATEVFLQRFRAVDQVVTVPMYTPSFGLTTPGYNDGRRGDRIYYAGQAVAIGNGHETISRFLDVMAFATEADRTNAVAAALTVLLRNHWPGAKPMIAVTSSKSHGGKDTIIEFAAGRTPHTSLSHEHQDWALQKNFAAVLHGNTELGVLNIENVRLDGTNRTLSSSFLERLITDPEPIIYTTGTGDPTRRTNDLVIACSTNFGNISEDLLNRSLPIHLTPVGDVASRRSPIGNPKLEYLPNNRARIEAELRGMVETWKEAGRPADETVRHPFTDWAREVGGILTVAGFSQLLGNYATRRTVDDSVRHALGLIGAARPDAWRRSQDWVVTVQELGLQKQLISAADRDSLAGCKRGLGAVLSAHRDETFEVETEDEVVVVQLRKSRRRFDDGVPQTRYRFDILDSHQLPVDDPIDDDRGLTGQRNCVSG